MYATLLTQYGFYLWNEQQICKLLYSKDEASLPFKLSANYTNNRDNYMKRIKKRFGLLLLFTYWGSFWCFLIPMNSLSGPVNSAGYTLDMYGMGFATMSSFVFFTHFLFAGQIRNWNRVIKVFVCIVASLYPLTIIVAQSVPIIGNFYKHIFEVLHLPLFWLAIPPALFMMVLPFYLERCY